MTNVISMPRPLDKLATDIKSAMIHRAQSRAEWIDTTLKLAALLVEAREQFKADQDFGVWLAMNDLDDLGKDDRAALLQFGSDLMLARDVIEATDSVSVQLMARTFKERRVLNAKIPAQSEPDTVVTPQSNVIAGDFNKSPETKTDNTEQPKAPSRKTPSRGANTLLVIEHGEVGWAVLEWLRPMVKEHHGGELNRIKLQLTLARLKPATLKRVWKFIETHRDELRPTLAAETCSASMFWHEAPRALVKDISGHLGGRADVIALKVISEWDTRIAPVMREWIDAGMPPDTHVWYRQRQHKSMPMKTPTISPELRAEAIAAGIDMDDTRFSVLPEHTIRQMIANKKPRTYTNEHELFRLPGQAPIRVFGRDIWPCPAEHGWTFRDAYYGYHLWQEADSHLRPHEPSAKNRGRILMNPFVPILTNINGAVGAVLKEIVNAQFSDSAKEVDTFGPPKMLLFKGE